MYPNPSAGEITIRLDQRITDACFEPISAQGSLVHRASISGQIHPRSTSNTSTPASTSQDSPKATAVLVRKVVVR